MGHRANVVVIEDGFYTLHYCHWCAQTLPQDLFWGPAYAVAHARRQLDARTPGPPVPMRRPDPALPEGPDSLHAEGWLDNVWAEGGAVIDLDQRVLLLWGGNEVRQYIHVRRVYMALLQEVWAGWEVRWALLGVLDMADHMGLSRQVVLADSDDEVYPLAGHIRRHPIRTVGSVLYEDGSLRLYPLTGPPELYLLAGPPLLDEARGEPGFETIDYRDQDGDPNRYLFWKMGTAGCLEPIENRDQDGYWMPMYGFHIDAGRQIVELWMHEAKEDPLDTLAPRWPRWQFHWLRDDYETHFSRLEGRLLLHEPAAEEILDLLQGILMDEPRRVVPGVVRMLENLQSGEIPHPDLKMGETVSVNPYTLTESPQEIAVERKREILDRAIAGWRSRRSPNRAGE